MAANEAATPGYGIGRWRRTLGAGLLGGIVASLALTLVMAVLRMTLGIPSTAEAIPDRIAPTLTIEQFFGLFDRYGGYNGLKQFGVRSVILGQLAVGTLGGLLYALVVEFGRARDPERPRRFGLGCPGLVFLAVVIAAAWVATLVGLRPVLGANFRGLSPRPAIAATALGLLLAYAGYGVALVLTHRLLTSSAPLRQPAPVGGRLLTRRAFLTVGTGAVLALASGVVIRRLFDRATFGYDGLQYRGPDVAPITPNERFYTVTKNVVDPNVARGVWRLEIGGLVERARAYSFDDLAALPATVQETTLMCISNGLDAGLMSNARWKGVPLRTLLEAAGPRPGVVEVQLHGADGYTDTFAFTKALDPTALLVYEMNGEPLPERHGYPVRVIVPGLYGEKNVKWVTRIELVDYDAKGFYERQGWGPDFVIPIRSRIDAPDFDRPLPPGAPVRLRGVAFGGDRGIARVEVSADDGRSWREARLDYPGTRLSWALWSFEWRPPGPGEYRLAVRATDGTGALQTAEERGIVPRGATGYHRVTARVG